MVNSVSQTLTCAWIPGGEDSTSERVGEAQASAFLTSFLARLMLLSFVREAKGYFAVITDRNIFSFRSMTLPISIIKEHGSEHWGV